MSFLAMNLIESPLFCLQIRKTKRKKGQERQKNTPKTARKSLLFDYQRIRQKQALKHKRLKTRPSRDQLRHMYNICTILVQYLYVYQLYIYCTSIVHILYNGRSWYGECTVKLWWIVGPAAWGGRGSGGKLKGPPHGEPFRMCFIRFYNLLF